MNSPQIEKVGFLSNHSLAYLMTSRAKYKLRSCFTKMEPYFDSILEKATSLLRNSCQVTTCKGPSVCSEGHCNTASIMLLCFMIDEGSLQFNVWLLLIHAKHATEVTERYWFNRCLRINGDFI